MKPGTLLRIIPQPWSDGVFIYKKPKNQQGYLDWENGNTSVLRNQSEVFMYLGQHLEQELYVLTSQGPGWIDDDVVEPI